MAINLIIKGNRYAAAQAAATRHIPMTFVRELHYGETIGVTCDSQWQRVSHWFMEDCGEHAPYPRGSLLHYSTIPESDT